MLLLLLRVGVISAALLSGELIEEIGASPPSSDRTTAFNRSSDRPTGRSVGPVGRAAGRSADSHSQLQFSFPFPSGSLSGVYEPDSGWARSFNGVLKGGTIRFQIAQPRALSLSMANASRNSEFAQQIAFFCALE